LLDEVRSNPLQTIEGQPEPWNFGSQGMLMAATR
jgi:hypothetical protein